MCSRTTVSSRCALSRRMPVTIPPSFINKGMVLGILAATEIVRRLYVKHEAFDWDEPNNFLRLFGIHPDDVLKSEREGSGCEVHECFARKNK